MTLPSTCSTTITMCLVFRGVFSLERSYLFLRELQSRLACSCHAIYVSILYQRQSGHHVCVSALKRDKLFWKLENSLGLKRDKFGSKKLEHIHCRCTGHQKKIRLRTTHVESNELNLNKMGFARARDALPMIANLRLNLSINRLFCIPMIFRVNVFRMVANWKDFITKMHASLNQLQPFKPNA